MTNNTIEGLLGAIQSFRGLAGENRCVAAAAESHDDNAVREKAYTLWEEAGRPVSDGVEFWLRAERELQGA